MLHPTYTQLITSTLNTSTLEAYSVYNPIVKYLDKALSAKFSEVDELNEKIEALKKQHTEDVFNLKLKLSDLIDANYKLLQEVNK